MTEPEQETVRRQQDEAARREAERREAERREAERREAAEVRRTQERRAAEREERHRRRRRRRQRPLRDKLLSENLRFVLSMALALLGGVAALYIVPELAPRTPQSREEQLALLLVMMIIIISLYTLIFTGLTYYALQGQPRERLVATARLPRVRKHVKVYQLLSGRSGPSGEVLQLVIIAGVAISLLATRPGSFPVSTLLGMTVASIVIAWIGSVMTFAVEYIAEDAHGEGFALPATPAAKRTLDEYLYAAVLVQASSGSSEVIPLTSSARRTMRNHVILAHVMSTIILTLGVSVVITAVG